MAALVALSGVASHAHAAKPRTIASYCSKTGDLCFGILNRSGAVSLEINTFAKYFDRYILCVKPPRRVATCRSFPVRRLGQSYVSRVRWYRNYPARGPGVYRVTWRLGPSRLGPSLTFRLPL